MLKDIFGRPGEGIHTHFYGIAIWDVVLTLIAAIVFAYFTGVSIWKTVIGFMLVAEGAHIALGVDTAVVRWFTS